MIIDFSNRETVLSLLLSLIIAMTILIAAIIIFSAIWGLVKRGLRAFKRPAEKSQKGASQVQKAEGATEPEFQTARRVPVEDFNFRPESKPEESVKSQIEIQKEGEQESIQEGLNALKAKAPKYEGWHSQMPSRAEQDVGQESTKIKIPVPKKSAEISEENTTRVQTPNTIVAKPPMQADRSASAIVAPGVAPDLTYLKKEYKQAEKAVPQEPEGVIVSQKPDFMKNVPDMNDAPEKKQEIAKPVKGGGSILFGSKEEISRLDLQRVLRRDPRIWKAQRDLRMNLSPLERVKLEKEFFASLYGRNISKRDVKMNLRRMGKEWASTSDTKRKETLRKQIKFLKNISGVSDPYK